MTKVEKLLKAHASQGCGCVQASHSNAQKQLQRTSQNLADRITPSDTLEEQLQSAGARYLFVQETKAYIADLCDMLQVQTLQPSCAHINCFHFARCCQCWLNLTEVCMHQCD